MARIHAIVFGSAVVALAGCAEQPQKQAQASMSPRVAAQFEAEPKVINGVPMVPTGEFIIVAPDPSATGYNDPYIQHRMERADAKQEYKLRKKEARQEYKEDKARADAEFRAAQERSSGR